MSASFNPKSYLLPNIDFDSLDPYSYFPFLEDIDDEHARALRPTTLVKDAATFHMAAHMAAADQQAIVTISYVKPNIYFTCDCSESGEFCNHKKRAFKAILKQPDLLAFFSEKWRATQLKKHLQEHNIPYITTEDSLLTLTYAHDRVSVQAVDPKILLLRQGESPQAAPDPTSHRSSGNKQSNLSTRGTILLFRAHKYYGQLQVQLAEGSSTKDGKLKNPIDTIASDRYLWKAQNLKESLFFAAVKEFEALSSLSKENSIRAALPHILNNPRAFPCFLHDATVSAHNFASALIPIQVRSRIEKLQISVQKEGDFYTLEISAAHDGRQIPFKEFTLELGYFLRYKDYMYFMERPEVADFLKLCSNNQDKVFIHKNQFNLLNDSYLKIIADYVSINYQDIPTLPTKGGLAKQSYDNRQVILYFEESQEFINILPVLRYDDMEVPIRSRRPVFIKNAQGQTNILPRKEEEEQAVLVELLKSHPYFEEQLSESFMHFYLHRDKFLDVNWFLPCFEHWRSLGYQLIGFKDIKQQHLNPYQAKITIQVLSGINWFNTQLEVKFGPQKASLKALASMLKNKRNQVLLDDGTWGVLPANWLKRMQELFHKASEQNDDFLQFEKVQFGELDQLFEVEELHAEVKQEVQLLKDKLLVYKEENTSPPIGFKGVLKPYQLQGYHWLTELSNLGIGGILADDMGLGKSIQALAFLLNKAPTHKTLLVVPTTLVFNWLAESKRFTPSLRILCLDGPQHTLKQLDIAPYDLLIITYSRLTLGINYLKKLPFDFLILDESQQIKNPDSQRYKAVKEIQAKSKFALTGTPLENSSQDLYAQFSIVTPGLLGSRKYFTDVYTRPIDAFDDYKRRRQLQELIAPFMLRRTKDAVLQELPEKEEQVVYCEMLPNQRNLYERYEKEFRDFIDAHTGDEIRKNAMHVLKGLLKLRQICNSPSLLAADKASSTKASSKVTYLVEQVLEQQAFQKIVIFSQFVEMLHAIKQELEIKGVKPLLLTGKSKDRGAIIDAFQEDEEQRVLLISLKAGGTGLNLTAANLLFLVEPWWNPAVEAQAIDRIYRMGQYRRVTAVRLITPNSIEEKMMQLKDDKRFIAEELVKALYL